MAKFERPASGYTSTSTTVNASKYQTDSASAIAISSQKVDGDVNKLIDAVNEIWALDSSGSYLDVESAVDQISVNESDISTINALTGGGSGQTTLANTLTDHEGRIVQNEADIASLTVAGVGAPTAANTVFMSKDGTTYTTDQVDTAQIKDDAVSLAKQASGTADRLQGFDASGNPSEITVDSTLTVSAGAAKVADGGVNTTQLADNAVTLAKMASGTAGNLITYDAAGDPAAVAVGTSGQVLTSNGAGAAPTMQDLPAAGNVPAFGAYLSGAQSINDSTQTKLQLDTELFDSDNCYDNTTNYRFTPTVAGKYFVYMQANISLVAGNALDARIYKNGAAYKYCKTWSNGTGWTMAAVSGIIDFNGTTDYVEFYIEHNNGVAKNANAGVGLNFAGAYKIV